MFTVQKTCPVCQRPSSIEVAEESYRAWQSGVLIQVAFADISPEQREVIQTGIHPACWNDLFADSDE